MSKTADPIIDSMNEVKEQGMQDISDKLQNLRDAANIFLNNIRKLYGRKESNKNLRQIKNHQNLLKNAIVQELIKNPKQSLEYIIGKNLVEDEKKQAQQLEERQKILNYIFKFQDAINNFLNIQTINMVFVDDDGILYELTQQQEKDILKTAQFDDGKFISLYLTQEQKEKSNILLNEDINNNQGLIYNKYIQQLYIKIMNPDDQKQFAEDKKNSDYNKLLPTLYKQRRNAGMKITDEGIITETFTTDFFLVTKRSQVITFNHVNNLGVLKEAYVAALFDTGDDIITEDMGYNEAANKLYDNYIKKVDNLYGIFGGDVSIKQDNKGSKDLAVKSGSFNSEKYSQLILFANYILSASNKSIRILNDLGKENNTSNMEKFFKDFTKRKISFINGKLNDAAAKEVQNHFKNINFKIII